MLKTDQASGTLTGEFKELVLLFSPILLMTFSTSLYLFVEKLFFARLSAQALEAAVSASIVGRVFQFPCMFLAMMAQVCVGRWHGSRDLKAIGPGIWQFIWFSFLSMLVTWPLSLWYGNYYFKGIEIENIVKPFYYFLISINFIYPLGATLTSLYLGQGKTRLILWATIGSQVLKFISAYVLIFGWGWIPSFGIMGGLISTLIAHGGFCILLLWVFLKPNHAAIYHSWAWRLNPKLFWECIHPGLMRAIGGVLVSASWASIAHLMTSKGEDYILILSIGGTLFIFLPFIGDAIGQAQTTIVSQILGARHYYLLDKAFRSATILVLIAVALIGIPMIIFPHVTFHYLFPKIVLDVAVVNKIMLGVWLSFVLFTFSYVPIGYILAYKDTRYSLFMGILNWVDGYLLMYFAIVIMAIAADQFWLVLSLMHGVSALLYYWRMKWLNAQELSKALKKIPT